MTVRIGFISPTSSINYIKQVEERFAGKCEFTYLTYNGLSELTNLYHSSMHGVDAFICSGELAFALLQQKINEFAKPTCCLSIKNEDLYGSLLRLCAEGKCLDFSRIYVDFAVPENNYLGLKEILPQDKFPLTFPFCADESVNEQVLENHLNLWKAGKIDLSVTASSNLHQTLKEKGIDAVHVSPSVSTVVSTVDSVINDVTLVEYDRNKNVVGRISLHDLDVKSPDFSREVEIKHAVLHKALIDFELENGIRFSIRRHDFQLEMMITKGDLAFLTENFTGCAVMHHLQQVLPFKVDIGWGIGNTVDSARQNAAKALGEAEKQAGNCSFIFTETEQVIGPLAEGTCMVYSNANDPLIQEASKKAGLSPITMQKLLGVMERLNVREMSSSDIASYLCITERSANRILSKLEQSGLAVSHYKKSEKLKGRPKKIYSLKF